MLTRCPVLNVDVQLQPNPKAEVGGFVHRFTLPAWGSNANGCSAHASVEVDGDLGNAYK